MCVHTHMCLYMHLGTHMSSNPHRREEEFVMKIKVTKRKKHDIGGVTLAGGRDLRRATRCF